MEYNWDGYQDWHFAMDNKGKDISTDQNRDGSEIGAG